MSTDNIPDKEIAGIDPNFPASIEEVEGLVNEFTRHLSCEEMDKRTNDEITPQDEFSPEENELISDILNSAAVYLIIHRDASQSEGGEEAVKGVVDGNLSEITTGWNHLYNRRFVIQKDRYDDYPFAILRPTGSSRRSIGGQSPFLFGLKIILYGGPMQDHLGTRNSLPADRELIMLRAVSGDLEDANMSSRVIGGSPDERAYILNYFVKNKGGYKYDIRQSFFELCAIIPESVAIRLDQAMRKNKKFRILLMRQLMQGAFPFLKGKEGDEYGTLRFDKDFVYIGPNVEARPLPVLTKPNYVPAKSQLDEEIGSAQEQQRGILTKFMATIRKIFYRS